MTNLQALTTSSSDHPLSGPARVRPGTTDCESDLAALVRAASGATSVTLAVVHDGRGHVWCHGSESQGGRPTTPATAYEIGSVTKTFTALLLAQLVAEGRIGLHDPIDAHLPPAQWPRTKDDTPITLLHLATHTSGLPRLPPGLITRALPAWFTNPYAAFDEEHFLHALPRTRTHRRPGTRVAYSNYGIALLGRVLATATATDYPALLAERICQPLGLIATHCGPPPMGQATGHRAGRLLPAFSIPALPAAGALRSTGHDLLRYLHAHLNPGDTPIAQALRDVQTPRLRTRRASDHLCLAWNLRHVGSHTLVFHSGATRGFTTFLGFAPDSGNGIAALTNTGPRLSGHFVQSAYQILKRLIR